MRHTPVRITPTALPLGTQCFLAYLNLFRHLAPIHDHKLQTDLLRTAKTFPLLIIVGLYFILTGPNLFLQSLAIENVIAETAALALQCRQTFLLGLQHEVTRHQPLLHLLSFKVDLQRRAEAHRGEAGSGQAIAEQVGIEAALLVMEFRQTHDYLIELA